MEEARKIEDVVGLCLSGGGFRASLFHLGSLRRLNELGVLRKVQHISSVSGGSITAAVLALAWPELERASWSTDALIQLVDIPVKSFCDRDIDARAIGEGALVPWRKASDVIIREYELALFGKSTLRDLPATPRFVFNATNLQTGRSVRLTKRYIADWTIGVVSNPDLSLATVVAASSAFPPFLSPVFLEHPGQFEKVEGSVHHDDVDYTGSLHLTDGGVYDNLGLEPIWKRCRTILVSDAGAPFAFGSRVDTDWVKQTLRALDIATDQARGLRKRWLVEQYERGARAGAYWGIDTCISDYPITDALPVNPAATNPLAKIRTRLNRFTPEEQGKLINWGYALCDAAVRSRAAELAFGASKPEGLPYPQQALL